VPKLYRSLALISTSNPPPELLLRELTNAGYVTKDDRFIAMQGGRTNRVWRFGDHVLKLYRNADSNPLFSNSPRSEIACLSALYGTGLAPRLLQHGKHFLGQWIIYQHVNGTGWNFDPAPVAKLLARVHTLAPLTGLAFGPNGSMKIRQQTLEILKQCRPDTRDHIAARMPTWSVSPINQLCLIHGDPVAGNIVIADKNPVLIDWQSPAIGDPVEDIALFLSPAMQKLYRGAPMSLAEEQEFLAAYPRFDIVDRYRYLKAWYHWRMAAYCQWQMEQGEADYAEGFELEYNCLSACNPPS
jgi:Phosphotransferase enzyme family